jgi:predicted kinase
VAEPRQLFVVVSGPPGSGKSTLAAPLARELDLPLLAKDTIKEALMSRLPVEDVSASKRLGGAAMSVMWALAPEAPRGAVLEANYHRSLAIASIRRLPGVIIEVFCRCEHDLALKRYQARASSRHPGHFDSARVSDSSWNREVAEPVAGGWPVLEVDTNDPVLISDVLADLRRLLPSD